MNKKLNRVIIANLNKQNARYLTPNDDWNLIVPHRELKLSKDYVRIKFSKKADTDSIKLSYPFQISKTSAYLYGLVLGAAVKKRDRLTIKVDTRQIKRIQEFCRQFQLRPTVKVINRRHKKRNKQIYQRYFKEAIVQIPNPIYQYLKALGLNLYRPRIPEYFPPNLKHLVIQGYLNSKRTLLIHHSTSPINQWIQIKASSENNKIDYAKKFILQIFKDFKYHHIKADLEIGDNHSIIKVKNGDIIELLKHYHIRRPQIRYSGKLIDLMRKYPHIRKTVNLFNLNSFQLTVLEIAFYYFYKRNCDFIEYTRFEELLSISSNSIRKVLYDFQEWGIIQYFAKGHKEFIRPTYLCFKHAEDHLRGKIEQIQSSADENSEIFFVCKDCGTSLDYTKAIQGGLFCCSKCGSPHLKEYSKIRLFRSLNNYKGQINQFKNSLEVMCYARCS